MDLISLNLSKNCKASPRSCIRASQWRSSSPLPTPRSTLGRDKCRPQHLARERSTRRRSEWNPKTAHTRNCLRLPTALKIISPMFQNSIATSRHMHRSSLKVMLMTTMISTLYSASSKLPLSKIHLPLSMKTWLKTILSQSSLITSLTSWPSWTMTGIKK